VLPMRIHNDRKQPDGAAIAFVVITLLTIVALEILLSRLNAFSEANAMAGEDARPNPIPVGHWNAGDQGRWDPTSWGFSRYEFGSRECGAPKVLLSFAHCWHAVGTAAAEAYCFVVASAKRSAVRCVSTSIGNSLMEMRSLSL
jgi:hypothetical protein